VSRNDSGETEPGGPRRGEPRRSSATPKKHADANINARQRDMINRLLDGFAGKLTSSKWATIEKCSPDTALRNINELLAAGILRKDAGGGRSTSYSLASSG